MIIHGDATQIPLADNCIDTCITDPPYGLGFMGKEWDTFDKSQFGIAGNEGENDLKVKKNFKVLPRYNNGGDLYNFTLQWATEVYRVLKPGALLLAFGGTRTYHRMVCAIEDAGFEIKDSLGWVYAQGFPKSLSISKSMDKKTETEWDKICKAIDKLSNDNIIKIWKKNLNDVRIVETQYLKNLIGDGINTPKSDSAQDSVLLSINLKRSYVNAIIAELSLQEAHRILEVSIPIAQENAEVNITQLPKNVKSVEKKLQNQNLQQSTTIQISPTNIFIAQYGVKDMLKENTTLNRKADEALKTCCGNLKSLNERVINALFVELIDGLKRTILNQSKTFQNLDMKSQTECVSATIVIITEYMAELLITYTVNMLKASAINKKVETEKEAQLWDGWGTALKPAMELIVVAMKPLDGTYVENALKWGVAGMWIDGGRIWTDEELGRMCTPQNPTSYSLHDKHEWVDNSTGKGRFPSDFIHDGSDEVLELFPNDAARFFYCAKASRAERNAGLEGVEPKWVDETRKPDSVGGNNPRNRGARADTNFHPCVKPLSLMQYLVRLTKTPTGGIVLDPFMGSGTTGCACALEGREFIGIEKEAEYVEIAEKRIAYWSKQPRLLINGE